MHSNPLFVLVLLACVQQIHAAPLTDAEVVHAINDVRVAISGGGEHPAGHSEIVSSASTLLTGFGSRAELAFRDQTLLRLGAQTQLRFKAGARELFLNAGTLLFRSPPFRGASRVHAGSLTATAGRATFLIEHLPEKSVKIAVLEGDLRVSVNGFLGDSILLTPGKLLITSPSVRRIPDPVDVDLRTLAKTSSLINPELFGGGYSPGSPLPSLKAIDRKIARQDALVAQKILIPTNLMIVGSGANMTIPAPAPLVSAPAAIANFDPELPQPAASQANPNNEELPLNPGENWGGESFQTGTDYYKLKLQP